jgi:diketogulonate reductase-like aldo/keto reductase
MPPLRDAHAFEISPGVRMPRLGLGTFKVRGEDATRVTLAALRAGCRHVDTASCYRNEEAIRDAVELWKEETKDDGADADDAAVFLTSKLAPSEMGDPARTREALLGVLVRLGRETREVKEEDEGFRINKGLAETRPVPKPLDLALVHWPAKAGAAPDDASHFVARRDAWRVLERARDAGSVRAIGVSNYTRAHLEEMRFYAEKHLPCVNQVELHPRCQQKELRAACAELRVGVVAYSPLGCGALLEDPRVVRCAAQLAAELQSGVPDRSVTPAQALLAWSLRQDGVVAAVCKSSDPARAAANVGAGGVAFATRLAELSDAAFRELDEMDDGTHFCWDPSVVR